MQSQRTRLLHVEEDDEDVYSRPPPRGGFDPLAVVSNSVRAGLGSGLDGHSSTSSSRDARATNARTATGVAHAADYPPSSYAALTLGESMPPAEIAPSGTAHMSEAARLRARRLAAATVGMEYTEPLPLHHPSPPAAAAASSTGTEVLGTDKPLHRRMVSFTINNSLGSAAAAIGGRQSGIAQPASQPGQGIFVTATPAESGAPLPPQTPRSAAAAASADRGKALDTMVQLIRTFSSLKRWKARSLHSVDQALDGLRMQASSFLTQVNPLEFGGMISSALELSSSPMKAMSQARGERMEIERRSTTAIEGGGDIVLEVAPQPARPSSGGFQSPRSSLTSASATGAEQIPLSLQGDLSTYGTVKYLQRLSNSFDLEVLALVRRFFDCLDQVGPVGSGGAGGNAGAGGGGRGFVPKHAYIHLLLLLHRALLPTASATEAVRVALDDWEKDSRSWGVRIPTTNRGSMGGTTGAGAGAGGGVQSPLSSPRSLASPRGTGAGGDDASGVYSSAFDSLSPSSASAAAAGGSGSGDQELGFPLPSFHSALFQLVDTWTLGCEVTEYRTLLATLFAKVTMVNPDYVASSTAPKGVDRRKLVLRPLTVEYARALDSAYSSSEKRRLKALASPGFTRGTKSIKGVARGPLSPSSATATTTTNTPAGSPPSLTRTLSSISNAAAVENSATVANFLAAQGIEQPVVPDVSPRIGSASPSSAGSGATTPSVSRRASRRGTGGKSMFLETSPRPGSSSSSRKVSPNASPAHASSAAPPSSARAMLSMSLPPSSAASGTAGAAGGMLSPIAASPTTTATTAEGSPVDEYIPTDDESSSSPLRRTISFREPETDGMKGIVQHERPETKDGGSLSLVSLGHDLPVAPLAASSSAASPSVSRRRGPSAAVTASSAPKSPAVSAATKAMLANMNALLSHAAEGVDESSSVGDAAGTGGKKKKSKKKAGVKKSMARRGSYSGPTDIPFSPAARPAAAAVAVSLAELEARRKALEDESSALAPERVRRTKSKLFDPLDRLKLEEMSKEAAAAEEQESKAAATFAASSGARPSLGKQQASLWRSASEEDSLIARELAALEGDSSLPGSRAARLLAERQTRRDNLLRRRRMDRLEAGGSLLEEDTEFDLEAALLEELARDAQERMRIEQEEMRHPLPMQGKRVATPAAAAAEANSRPASREQAQQTSSTLTSTSSSKDDSATIPTTSDMVSAAFASSSLEATVAAAASSKRLSVDRLPTESGAASRRRSVDGDGTTGLGAQAAPAANVAAQTAIASAPAASTASIAESKKKGGKAAAPRARKKHAAAESNASDRAALMDSIKAGKGGGGRESSHRSHKKSSAFSSPSPSRNIIPSTAENEAWFASMSSLGRDTLLRSALDTAVSVVAQGAEKNIHAAGVALPGKEQMPQPVLGEEDATAPAPLEGLRAASAGRRRRQSEVEKLGLPASSASSPMASSRASPAASPPRSPSLRPSYPGSLAGSRLASRRGSVLAVPPVPELEGVLNVEAASLNPSLLPPPSPARRPSQDGSSANATTTTGGPQHTAQRLASRTADAERRASATGAPASGAAGTVSAPGSRPAIDDQSQWSDDSPLDSEYSGEEDGEDAEDAEDAQEGDDVALDPLNYSDDEEDAQGAGKSELQQQTQSKQPPQQGGRTQNIQHMNVTGGTESVIAQTASNGAAAAASTGDASQTQPATVAGKAPKPKSRKQRPARRAVPPERTVAPDAVGEGFQTDVNQTPATEGTVVGSAHQKTASEPSTAPPGSAGGIGASGGPASSTPSSQRTSAAPVTHPRPHPPPAQQKKTLRMVDAAAMASFDPHADDSEDRVEAWEQEMDELLDQAPRPPAHGGDAEAPTQRSMHKAAPVASSPRATAATQAARQAAANARSNVSAGGPPSPSSARTVTRHRRQPSKSKQASFGTATAAVVSAVPAPPLPPATTTTVSGLDGRIIPDPVLHPSASGLLSAALVSTRDALHKLSSGAGAGMPSSGGGALSGGSGAFSGGAAGAGGGGGGASGAAALRSLPLDVSREILEAIRSLRPVESLRVAPVLRPASAAAGGVQQQGRGSARGKRSTGPLAIPPLVLPAHETSTYPGTLSQSELEDLGLSLSALESSRPTRSRRTLPVGHGSFGLITASGASSAGAGVTPSMQLAAAEKAASASARAALLRGPDEARAIIDAHLEAIHDSRTATRQGGAGRWGDEAALVDLSRFATMEGRHSARLASGSESSSPVRYGGSGVGNQSESPQRARTSHSSSRTGTTSSLAPSSLPPLQAPSLAAAPQLPLPGVGPFSSGAASFAQAAALASGGAQNAAALGAPPKPSYTVRLSSGEVIEGYGDAGEQPQQLRIAESPPGGGWNHASTLADQLEWAGALDRSSGRHQPYARMDRTGKLSSSRRAARRQGGGQGHEEEEHSMPVRRNLGPGESFSPTSYSRALRAVVDLSRVQQQQQQQQRQPQSAMSALVGDVFREWGATTEQEEKQTYPSPREQDSQAGVMMLLAHTDPRQVAAAITPGGGGASLSPYMPQPPLSARSTAAPTPALSASFPHEIHSAAFASMAASFNAQAGLATAEIPFTAVKQRPGTVPTGAGAFGPKWRGSTLPSSSSSTNAGVTTAGEGGGSFARPSTSHMSPRVLAAAAKRGSAAFPSTAQLHAHYSRPTTSSAVDSMLLDRDRERDRSHTPIERLPSARSLSPSVTLTPSAAPSAASLPPRLRALASPLVTSVPSVPSIPRARADLHSRHEVDVLAPSSSSSVRAVAAAGEAFIASRSPQAQGQRDDGLFSPSTPSSGGSGSSLWQARPSAAIPPPESSRFGYKAPFHPVHGAQQPRWAVATPASIGAAAAAATGGGGSQSARGSIQRTHVHALGPHESMHAYPAANLGSGGWSMSSRGVPLVHHRPASGSSPTRTIVGLYASAAANDGGGQPLSSRGRSTTSDVEGVAIAGVRPPAHRA